MTTMETARYHLQLIHKSPHLHTARQQMLAGSPPMPSSLPRATPSDDVVEMPIKSWLVQLTVMRARVARVTAVQTKQTSATIRGYIPFLLDLPLLTFV